MRGVVRSAVLAGLVLSAVSGAARAADIVVLTAGAYKKVLLTLAPQFERETGHRLLIDNDTVGALVKRIEAGATFDVAILSRGAHGTLAKQERIVEGTVTPVARAAIGVMVREGAALPDVSTEAAVRATLLAAPSIAYIDPASGGSTGIYLASLFERMGIAGDISPKVKLKKGGYVADLVASGEAALGLHNISEIVGRPGVVFVGPLPDSIQNYTVYAAGVANGSAVPEAARALVAMLDSASAAALLAGTGLEKP